MSLDLDRVSPADLHHLNRGSLTGHTEILRLFQRLRSGAIILRNGINRRNDAREATVVHVAIDRIWLRGQNIEKSRTGQIYFNFDLGGTQYFFAAVRSINREDSLQFDADLVLDLPDTVFKAERRDLYRQAALARDEEARKVEIRASSRPPVVARLVDTSLYGMGLEVRAGALDGMPDEISVQFTSDEIGIASSPARIQYRSTDAAQPGWIRVGVHLGNAPDSAVEVDRRASILARSRLGGWRTRADVVRSAISAVPSRAMRKIGMSRPSREDVPVVEYCNGSGQQIRGILESVGDRRGSPAVVIPPAWGRTKETLQPLAATILETFERAGEAVTVLRFDGTNRRGESYIDPMCRAPGNEYLRFTFSQAVRDIQASVNFLYSDPSSEPSAVVLTTFSLAAIEGRRAVALNERNRIAGWVSTVGMIDLQSALRTISGGIDYGYGLLQGVRFGRHELVGVVADMDHTGLDAIRNQLGFLEETRRDFRAIEVPVTWIHGRHDAWMDLDRVVDALSHGDIARRRLIEVPTGHQLRTSQEALSTFQLIAEEVSEMALERRLAGRLPSIRKLEAVREAEQRRRPKMDIDLRSFWQDYLLGRDRRLGMQLITSTTAYHEFMDAQIDHLGVFDGCRIADLGAGTGELPIRVAARLGGSEKVAIDEVDYVADALARGSERLKSQRSSNSLRVERVIANLEVGAALAVPLRSGCYDSVLASLLISYLQDPRALLREAFRMLRPGGRIVVSSLRRDADISGLYTDGMGEFATAQARRSIVGTEMVGDFDQLARAFLNDASKILDLEERGRFRFWDPSELESLIKDAGFTNVSSLHSFGDPPQAVVVSGQRP